MSRLVFFLEEPSAKALLESLMPRLLPGVCFVCLVFQGKQQLDKELPKRLRAWQVPGDRFIVLRDQDGDDCVVIKKKIAALCNEGQKPDTTVRIACRELEAWYFGDLAAVEKVMTANGLAGFSTKKKYRIPDQIVNPSYELSEITENAYQKIDGSRQIGQYMDLDPGRNSSASFNAFIESVRRLVG